LAVLACKPQTDLSVAMSAHGEQKDVRGVQTARKCGGIAGGRKYGGAKVGGYPISFLPPHECQDLPDDTTTLQGRGHQRPHPRGVGNLQAPPRSPALDSSGEHRATAIAASVAAEAAVAVATEAAAATAAVAATIAAAAAVGTGTAKAKAKRKQLLLGAARRSSTFG